MSKKNKRRQCPALGKEITSADCGADRISRISCTADCPFNTFGEANYDDLGEVEDTVIRKVQDRLYGSMPFDRMHAFRDRVLGAAEYPDRVHYYHLREMHLETDNNGRNFFDRWEAENWKGLNNDERTVIQLHRRTRPALLEIQRVLNDVSVEAVDLLHPENGPMVVVDRNTAQRARRFQTAAVWVYPAPHYTRVLGAGRTIDDTGPCSPLETVQEIARHLGGPDELPGLEKWLWTEWLRFADACANVITARWIESVNNVDAISGVAEYRITGPESALHDLLLSHPDVEEVPPEPEELKHGFEHVYSIVEPAGMADSAVPGLRVFMGTLRMGAGALCADATSTAAFARLKQWMADLAGDHLEFVSERVDEIAKQLAARRARSYDPSLVPPRLLEQPQKLNVQTHRGPRAETPEEKHAVELDSLQKMLDALPDTPSPRLNGLTPRQASADPALRPALLRLMKGHVKYTDDLRQRRGFDVDINHVLEELGLHEIIFPPVPLPEVPEDEVEAEYEYDDDDDDDDEFGDDFADLDGEHNLEAAPVEEFDDLIPEEQRDAWLKARPVRAPLSEAAVAKLNKSTIRTPQTMEKASSWLQENWPELCEFLEIGEDDGYIGMVTTVLMHNIALAAHGLFRDGSRDGDINFERLDWFWAVEASLFREALEGARPEHVDAFLADSPQPELMKLFAAQMKLMSEQLPPVLEPRHALQLLPLLKALLREFSLLEP